MEKPKDIISKLFDRIDDPLLASMFMYLIYVADENGVISASYSDIGKAFRISKQLAYKYVGRLRSVYGVFTDSTVLTISNIGYYRGFSHTSFTQRLRSVDDKQKEKPKEKATETLTDDPKMNEVIKVWLEYKKEKKQTYKPTGLKTLITKLQKLSGNNADVAMRIVEQSMANNYSGLFPLRSPLKEGGIDTGVIAHDLKNKDYDKGAW